MADPRIERVRTVARGPLAEHPKVVHTRADLCDGATRRALGGVDVLWHLGAQLWRSRDGRQIAVNIDGTTNVLAARPGHVVLASSAAVYGAHPSNPLPITEAWAPRPNADCPYAWHKLEAERRCRDAGPAAILRLGAVLGPHADPRIRRATAGYRVVVPVLAGVPLALQFLAEDEAAGALVIAGLATACGTWNVATEDWLDGPGIAGVAGGRILRLPPWAAVRGSEIAYRLRLLPFGADRASLLGGPLALDASLARSDLGWVAGQRSSQVLGDFLGPAPQAGRWYRRQVL